MNTKAEITGYKVMFTCTPLEKVVLHPVRFGYFSHVATFQIGIEYLHIFARHKYKKEYKYRKCR